MYWGHSCWCNTPYSACCQTLYWMSFQSEICSFMGPYFYLSQCCHCNSIPSLMLEFHVFRSYCSLWACHILCFVQILMAGHLCRFPILCEDSVTSLASLSSSMLPFPTLIASSANVQRSPDAFPLTSILFMVSTLVPGFLLSWCLGMFIRSDYKQKGSSWKEAIEILQDTENIENIYTNEFVNISLWNYSEHLVGKC